MRFLLVLSFFVAATALAAESAAMQHSRVTQKYADILQAAAKQALEENRRNDLDLESAIQRTDRKFYETDLKARLERGDPLMRENQVVSTDATLYGFCSEYGQALKTLAHVYFEKPNQDDQQYWKATIEQTSKKCECFVSHPAGVKEIRAHRAVMEGGLSYDELESANDRYKQYLGQCLTHKHVD